MQIEPPAHQRLAQSVWVRFLHVTSKIFLQPPKRRSDVLVTSPQRQIGTSLSSRGNFGNSVRSSWRRGKCVSKSSTVSIPRRRNASKRDRGIQLRSSSDCETGIYVNNAVGDID